MTHFSDFQSKPLPYMGAKTYDPAKLKRLVGKNDPSLLVEDKVDGVYMTVNCWTGKITKRSGKDIPIECLGILSKDLSNFWFAGNTGHLVGELVAYIDGEGYQPREHSAGYLNSAIHDGKCPENVRFIYFCWGLYIRPTDTIEMARTALHLQINPAAGYIYIKRLVSTYTDDLVSEGYVTDRIQYSKTRPKKCPPLDGMIYKLGSQVLKAGKPGTCLKYKPPKTAYMYCTGTKPHTKRPDEIGSLLLELSTPKGELVSVYAGSGLTDEMRKEPESKYLAELIEIQYEDLTEPNKKGVRSLTHPRVIGFADNDAKCTSWKEFIDG